MTEKKNFTWKKDHSASGGYLFRLSPKLMGRIKRKSLWSPDGSAEMGDRELRFSSIGKAKMSLSVIDGSSQEQLGKLNFYWKDFQKSQLELNNGSVF